ncbi:MAG: RNA pseudouridine synthase, partial [Actinomyces sp.]|nr:RNA pseudouridine synthase [Actinomyces sp.]
MSDTRLMPVPDALVGERVDAALSRILGLSRSRCSELILDQNVTINGTPASKSDRLGENDLLEITIPEPETPVTPVVGMDILYDDDDIVVVNKPVGVAAHSGPGWTGPTVVGNLAAAGYRITTHGPVERQGIVHRLDVGTSGAMMVAKSELAYSVMKRAFKERTVRKIYHAVVAGHPDPASGTIDAPIGRHPSR